MSDLADTAPAAAEPSTPAAEPAAPPASRAEAARPHEDAGARRGRASEALRAALGRQTGATDAPAPEPATPAAEPAQAPPSAEAQRDAREAAQAVERAGGSPQEIAQAIRDAFAADRAKHEAEKRAQQLEQELAQERADREKRLKDPLAKHFFEGGTFEGAAQAMVEGKFKERTPAEVAIDQARERADKLEAEIRELRDIETRRQQEAALATKRAAAKEALTASAEKYAFASSLSWAADTAPQRAEQMGLDLDTYYARLDDAANKDAVAFLSNDRALARLLSNKDLRDRVAKALGTPAAATTEQKTPTTAAPADRADARVTPPRTITQSVGAEPLNRTSRPLTQSERKQRASAAFRAQRAQR